MICSPRLCNSTVRLYFLNGTVISYTHEKVWSPLLHIITFYYNALNIDPDLNCVFFADILDNYF